VFALVAFPLRKDGCQLHQWQRCGKQQASSNLRHRACTLAASCIRSTSSCLTAAGGTADLFARQFDERLGVALRIAVVVENKAGASGVIGTEMVAPAAPDGYTLLFATSATQVIAAHAMDKLPYDPLRDVTPLINLGYATSVVVVDPALPVHTLAELIAYARARPGRGRAGSTTRRRAQARRITSTPRYSRRCRLRPGAHPLSRHGGRPSRTLSGEVQLMVGAITSALPYIEAGKLRAVVMLHSRRGTRSQRRSRNVNALIAL
jgi:tripartite-type tricarboxylate transporter receptor subunit TctC